MCQRGLRKEPPPEPSESRQPSSSRSCLCRHCLRQLNRWRWASRLGPSRHSRPHRQLPKLLICHQIAKMVTPPPTLFSEVAVLGSETDSVADDAPASGAVVASVTEGISIANTKHRATVANSAEPLSRLRWRRSHGWYLRPFCRVLNFPVPISHSAPPPRAIERNVFGLQERKRRTTRPHGSNTPWDCLRLFSYPTNVPNCQDFIRNLFEQVYLHRYRYEIPLFSG